jgi:hypothetical protein
MHKWSFQYWFTVINSENSISLQNPFVIKHKFALKVTRGDIEVYILHFTGLFHTLPRAPADAAAPELAPVRTAEASPWGLGAAASPRPAVGLARCVRLGSPPWSRPFRNLIIGVWGLQRERLVSLPPSTPSQFAFESVRATFYATTFFKFNLHVSPFFAEFR